MNESEEILKKEFYQLNERKGPTIGLLMMLKNEEKRILVSLKSVIGAVDALIIYDTGSTDRTIEIVEKFAQKYKINLYLKKGEFVDFSTSRNVSLDLADQVDVDYLLLLDCNDELRGGDALKILAKKYQNEPNSGFLVCQQWWHGQMDKYYNIRFVKNRQGWRYMGSVHEWMKDTKSDTDTPRYPVIKLDDEIVLYQDRTKDDDKTKKRFKRDRDLLLADYKKNPRDPRTLFYLAQTCQCLGLHDEALYYSKLRLELSGFLEERFHSYVRCGDCCLLLGHTWSECMKWYLRAYEEFNRVEPLVKIADYYRQYALKMKSEGKGSDNAWNCAYLYANQACQLQYPTECILFVDKGMYDYYRWHLMGIIGFYVGQFEQGKDACIKAIAQGIDKELNEKNLETYLKKDSDKTKNQPVILSPKEIFFRTQREVLLKQFPFLQPDKLEKRINAMWKKKGKKM